MKLLFAILTIMLLAQSCRVVKPVKTVFKDSIVTVEKTITKSDTTYLPGDSVEIWQAIPCPDAKIDTVIKHGHTTLSTKILNGFLRVDCRTDSLQHIIDSINILRERQEWHSEFVEVPVDRPVPYIPKWVWYLVAWSVGSLIWKFRKPILALFKIAV